MSPAEWIEMSQQAASNAAAIYAIFLTIMSAYIVASYVVGRDLNRGQTTLINSFYLFSALVSIVFLLMAARNYVTAFNLAAVELEELRPISDTVRLSLLLVMGVGNSAFMMAGLKFMWDIRHPKPE